MKLKTAVTSAAALLLGSALAFAQSGTEPSESYVLDKAREAYQGSQAEQPQAAPAPEAPPAPYSPTAGESGTVPRYPFVFTALPGLSLPFGEFDVDVQLGLIMATARDVNGLQAASVFANARDVEWMAGGEYRLIQVSAPVQYMGDSEGLEGEYVFVIWENKACPIIGGREEDGMPKVFADIASERHIGDRWFTSASFESFGFLSMDFTSEREMSERDIAVMNENPKVNFFGWRYLPNLGKGGAALSRRNFGETIAHMTAESRFGYQFCANRAKYAEHPEQCPVDAHELVAPIVYQRPGTANG